ncbi:MAG: restriction endonuclease subunit S, partial [Shewanella sp.]
MGQLLKYSDYKSTNLDWCGHIPKHWPLIPCRAAVEHIVEKNHDSAVQNYLSVMANIGVIPYEDKGDIGNKKPDDLSKCKLVKKGQLVINSMNYSIGSYGMSDYDGVCSPVYIILQAKADIIHKRFALRVFENTHFQKHLAKFGNGILAHRSAIGWDDIKGQYIPIPPMDEQKKILNFLDHETAKIDALIEKQQQLISLLQEKRQAVISHAVTNGLNPDVPMKDSGVEWLGQVPEHWEIKQLKHFGVIVGGFAFKSSDFTDEGYPVIKISNVSHLAIDWSDRSYLPESFVAEHRDYIAPKGALVFAMTRPIISGGIKVFLMDDESLPLINQRVGFMKATDNEVSRFILMSSLSNSFIAQFTNNMTVTNQPNISGEG